MYRVSLLSSEQCGTESESNEDGSKTHAHFPKVGANIMGVSSTAIGTCKICDYK